jgi:hypothetical protein
MAIRKDRGMKATRQSSAILGLLVILSCCATMVSAQVAGSITETFSTTTFRNSSQTTAVWSTADGEIRLDDQFAMTNLGSYNTVGLAYEVVVEGDYAFVADGSNGLVVLNISNPSGPTQIGHYNTAGVARALAVDGQRVYLADGTLGLRIFNVQIPNNPAPIATLGGLGTVNDVVFDGRMIYAASSTGIHVIDASNTTLPTLVGSFSGILNGVGLDIEGDLLYVADNDYVWIMDITDPTSLVMAGYYNPSGTPCNVTVDGNTAYVSDRTDGLLILDVTNPGSPVYLGNGDSGGDTRAVTICGDFAYVSDYNDGLVVLDVQNPTSANIVDYAPISPTGVASFVDGEYVFLAAEGDGVEILTAAERMPLNSINNLDDGYTYLRPVIDGNLAFVPCSGFGLRILDISDPEFPVFVGNYKPAAWSMQTVNVAVSGNYAYVADNYQGFLILDISDPTNPSLVTQYATPCRDVAVAGGQAYVVRGTGGYHAYDVSDPTSPFYIGGVTTGQNCEAITLEDSYAYVSAGNSGLIILEVNSSFGLFSTLSTISTGMAQNVAKSGNYLYLANYTDGVRVIDVSSHTSPNQVASFGTAGPALNIHVNGDQLIVSETGDGIERYDISNPLNPTLIDAYNTGASSYGVAFSGDYMYMSNSSNGLRVFALYQRKFNTADNFVSTYPRTAPAQSIIMTRVTATQTETMSWLVSVDNGTSYTPSPVDVWTAHTTETLGLRWQAELSLLSPRTGPSCSNLQIDYLFDIPIVDTISDVPDDQGRQASLSFTRSGHDHLGSAFPIVEYAVYRRIAGTAKSADTDKAYPPGDWHYLLSVPADAEDTYSVVVPTLADSTVSDGLAMSTFFVRARTATPGIYFDAAPDSGYSVDNLSPSIPTGLKMTATDQLAWDELDLDDFRYFTVYAADGPELTEAAVPLGHTTGLEFDVSGQSALFYLLTATDFAGNESPAAALDRASAIPGDTLPGRFALLGNHPNPFNPSTTIRFELAENGPVRLTVYDLAGRLVRTLVNGRVLTIGSHQTVWNGLDNSGGQAAAGVYLYRLEAGDRSETRRMALIK